MTRRRILVFAPYLPALGGGERYACGLAQVAAGLGTATLAGPKPSEGRRLRLGFEWPCPFRDMHVDEFTTASADYDLAIVMTNGMPPESRAGRSLLVVQFPFEPLRDWRARQRVLSYAGVIVYSEYVRGWLRRLWGVDATIVNPPVDGGTYDPRRKRNRVLAVGRFFVGAHEKRHDVLIAAWSALESQLDADWRLTLAGGALPDPSTRDYLDRLARAAEGHRIDLAVNVPEPELRAHYGESQVFWHATGFGRLPDQPEKAEHFGLTTVEAMSYGAVPVVYADGGQLEIVSDSNGHTWRTATELADLTLALAADHERRHRLAATASQSVAKFSFAQFSAKVRRLLGD